MSDPRKCEATIGFPPYCVEKIAFDNISCSSKAEMERNKKEPHVKQIEFRIPRFKACPSVSVQIVGHVGASLLAVYSLKINDCVRSGVTQIAIEAQTIHGGKATGVHHCNIIAIGPLLKNARKRRRGRAPSAPP